LANVRPLLSLRPGVANLWVQRERIALPLQPTPMNARRSAVFAGLLVMATAMRASAAEREQNAWPVLVRETDAAGQSASWTAAGPLVFHQRTPEGGTVGGIRPIWVEQHNAQGDFRSATFLYPIFSYHQDETTYRWTVLELIRRTARRSGAPAAQSEYDPRGDFEVWPFWFSRQSGDPSLNYRGLFPVVGTVKNKFGLDRASWVLFPVYAQTDKRGAITTSIPWPFVRITRGAAHGGGLWPIFTSTERPGVSREQYWLWPLGYNLTRQPAPDDPAGTAVRRDVGMLPFYARSTGPGYINENFLWPFFGYTDRTTQPASTGFSLFQSSKPPANATPLHYHETRYFWPLFVQGRSDRQNDGKYVNRWAPLYTHSLVNGYDKTWYAWPLVRHAQWSEPDYDVTRARTQLFYFVFWSETQRRITRPDASPARLTHVWPLYSGWNNGAGRRQWQVPSPLDVFFPQVEQMKYSWTPFFALIRHDQTAPGDTRTSILWNAVTWERHDADHRCEFHLGPLFSRVAEGNAERIAIGNGLLGWQRTATGGWHVFWLDFPRKATTTTTASR
jgi:hypothetical protein